MKKRKIPLDTAADLWYTIAVMDIHNGVSPSGKAQDFDSCIRRSESGHPSQKKALAQASAFFNDVCLRQMMTATPNDVRFANDVCLAAHFMAKIASLRNEVEQHHICEANASYRRRRCFIVIRGQIRTTTLEMFTKL